MGKISEEAFSNWYRCISVGYAWIVSSGSRTLQQYRSSQYSSNLRQENSGCGNPQNCLVLPVDRDLLFYLVNHSAGRKTPLTRNNLEQKQARPLQIKTGKTSINSQTDDDKGSSLPYSKPPIAINYFASDSAVSTPSTRPCLY